MSTRSNTNQREKDRANKNDTSQVEDLISPLAPGLTVVAIEHPASVLDARQTFETMVRLKSHRFGIPLPRVKTVTSLYSGGGRSLEAARIRASAETLSQNAANHLFKKCGVSAGFDFLCEEGRCSLLPIVEKATGNMVTLAQAISGHFDLSRQRGLDCLHQTAFRCNAYAVLFADVADAALLTPLSDQFELISVRHCEPDPGFSSALAFECVGLAGLCDNGTNHVMCNVRREDGKMKRKWGQFVSTDLRDRVMWKMRGQGATLDEIGEVVDLDKSNVKRRLDKLIPPVKLKLEDGWLDGYREALTL